MMGMPPPTLASNATARSTARARAKISGPCSARSALLAVTTCLPASRQSSTIRGAGSVPSHRLDHDFDLRIVDQPGDLGCDPNALEVDPTGLRGIADDGPFPADSLSRPAGDAVGLLGQDPGDARPDRPQSDQTDRDLFHVLRRSPRGNVAHQTCRGTRGAGTSQCSKLSLWRFNRKLRRPLRFRSGTATESPAAARRGCSLGREPEER